jgi:hypothetical protein
LNVKARTEEQLLGPCGQPRDLSEGEVTPDDTPSRRPAVNLTPVVVTAEIVVGAVVIARVLARRPSVPRTKVTMGPGGWVSVKGGTVGVPPGSRPWRRPLRMTDTRSSSSAPIWARALSPVPRMSGWNSVPAGPLSGVGAGSTFGPVVGPLPGEM